MFPHITPLINVCLTPFPKTGKAANRQWKARLPGTGKLKGLKVSCMPTNHVWTTTLFAQSDQPEAPRLCAENRRQSTHDGRTTVTTYDSRRRSILTDVHSYNVVKAVTIIVTVIRITTWTMLSTLQWQTQTYRCDTILWKT